MGQDVSFGAGIVQATPSRAARELGEAVVVPLPRVDLLPEVLFEGRFDLVDRAARIWIEESRGEKFELERKVGSE